MLSRFKKITCDRLFLCIILLYTINNNCTILNALDNCIYYSYLSFCNFNLNHIEKMLLINIFARLENLDRGYFYSVKYHHLYFMQNSNSILSLFHNSIIFEDQNISFLPEFYISNQKLGFMSFFFVLLSLGVLYSLRNVITKNQKRKLFHLFLFFYFFDKDVKKMLFGKYLILCLLFFADKMSTNTVLRSLLSKKDRSKYTFSHIYLLAGCVYPSFVLDKESYRCLLIAVCFLDGLASLPGKMMGSKEKTIMGSMFGIIGSCCIHKIIGLNMNKIFFYFLIGALENVTTQNDNLVIPCVGTFLLHLYG